MMNRLVLAAILSAAGCLSLHSETTETGYSYADGELFPYGTARSETVDVAMCIDNPALAGFKVTSVKAYVNPTEGLSSTSLWMSSELKLEKKVNVPDIWSASVEVEKGAYTDAYGNTREVGVLEYKPEQPYELTGNTVYVGYSLKVDNIDTESLKEPVLLGKSVSTEGFFIHTNKTVIHWTNYSEKTGGAALICLTLERESTDASLGIQTIYPVYASENDPFTTEVKVLNTGTVPVNTIAYRYTPDNGDGAKSGLLELDTPIVPGLIYPTTLSLKMEGMAGLGNHIVPLEILEVNGKSNTSPARTGNIDLTVIPFVPKHRPLIEEYTGLWCQYCTRGYIGMELIGEFYGDRQVSVCFHNNDVMMVTTEYPVEIPGYPSASIDRAIVLDPYYGTYQDIDFGVHKNVDSSLEQLAIADLDIAVLVEGTKILTETSVRFIKDIKDADYQVGYILTCDGLTDPSWLQNNAYSGAAGFKDTYLEQAVEWPKYISGLIFNDVAVDVAGMIGIGGSLPKDMLMGERYSHSYEFNIEYNNLINDIDNVGVVAFILDKKTGKVVNANKVYLKEATGVEDISAEAEPVASEYYDLLGRKTAKPAEGIFIRVAKYADGKIVSEKVRF